MQVGVLGPTQVVRGSEPVDLGTRKQRALLAALALHGGRPVSVDAIVDLLWGDDPPGAVTATLQAYVAGLRRALEPDRQRRAPAAFLVTVGSGYALRVPPEQLDAVQFAKAVAAAHTRLAPVAALVPNGRARLHRGDLAEVVRDLEAALGLWRGEPYAELEDAPGARAERVRLDELRLLAVEDRALAQAWLGQQATAAAELEALTTSHPLRERLWGLRALALARSGRQADALAVLRQVRTVLDEELGLEPGNELRALQTAVLRQDSALEWVAPDAPAPARAGPDPDVHPTRPVHPARAPGTWPLVGRGPQLAALGDLLEEAVVAGPTFASLIGEPGIGKTRLATELITRARAAGFTVLTGRCSQDDGAPPLWPWASVLSDLGAELPSSGPQEPEVTQFAAWEQIVGLVLDAASTRPVLLVFDDLHWADPASLRVLRMLAESTAPGQLMVLATWRAHPEPVGPHADLVEMLARRHALRLDLTGLTAAESAEIVQSVAHTEPSIGQAAALRDRTEGNPFFLVEYARLAAERGDLARLLAEEIAPTAVHDVLTRRLDRLPEQTRTVLRTAAVLGRQFDLALLAAASGVDEDELLDRLEPALAAGLVREDGIDQFTFAHALVRDTTRSLTSVSRRARVHVRAAEALQHRAGRETELARHWFAAGPAYADRAWRAGLAAAAVARQVYAHEEAADQLRNALGAMDDDPAAQPLDRYEVLMQLVDAYRWAGDWPELVGTVEQAVQIAEQIGDMELVAQAAVSTTIGALWQSARHGGAHPEIIAALRRCLERLPAADNPTRCRVMLSLANELYYSASFGEREALVTEALAMAERLADEQLLLDANQIAFGALWTSETARERLGYATRSMELARRLGEERAFAVSATLRTVVLGELGLVEEMWSALATARAEAERLRMPYGLIVLETLQVPWLAMAGRFAEAEARLPVIQRLDEQMSLEQSGDAYSGAVITLRLWQGRVAEIAGLIAAMEAGPFPITSTMVSCLLRAGRTADAERYYRSHVVDLSGNDWFSRLNWGTGRPRGPGDGRPRGRCAGVREAGPARRAVLLCRIGHRHGAGGRVSGSGRGDGGGA